MTCEERLPLVAQTYENLNSGSVELTSHQVRKAVYPGPYIDLVDKVRGQWTSG